MPYRFSPDTVNWFVLRKQHLVTKVSNRDPVSVVQRIGPLRGAPSVTAYLSLWARMADVRRETVDDALYQDRSLVRMLCVHGRLYIVPRDSYCAYHQAAGSLFGDGLGGLETMLHQVERQPEQKGAPGPGDLSQRVLEVLSARGPLSTRQLYALLPELNTKLYVDPELSDLGYVKLGKRLIASMCAEGMLVRAEPDGPWYSNVFRFVASHAWLGARAGDTCTPGDALRRLIEDYVTAFGPVSIGDIMHWLGAYPRRLIAATLMEMDQQLVQVRISGSERSYVLMQSQLPELLSAKPPDDIPVRLLPEGDTLLSAYADRTRFVAAGLAERVYDWVGEPIGSVWIGARIGGVWWLRVRAAQIIVRLFHIGDPAMLAMVGEEARQLGLMLGLGSVDIDIGAYHEGSDETDAKAQPVRVLGSG